ncbi:MAG: guanylate kinase [Leptospirales bacterium]
MIDKRISSVHGPDPEDPLSIYGKKLYHPLLFVVSAPSGAGKTSLCREIARRTNRIHYSVSYTTRHPRPGEQDGVDYNFVSLEAFKEMSNQKFFIESAEVYGNFYGTSRKTIQDSFDRDQDILVDIDIQGARKIRDSGIDNISIYILPPSHSILRERLALRGQDSEETVRKRLARVKQEIFAYNEYDYLIFNVDFQQAVDDLHAIVVSEHHRQQRLTDFVSGHFIPNFENEDADSTSTSLKESR